MSLRRILPTPKNTVWDREDERRWAKSEATKVGVAVSVKITAPPYGQRKDWVPRTEADYGDGGAFPEIHVAQYPLGLGAPGNMGKKSDALPIRLDDKGKVKYNDIARQGHGKDKLVYSSISQLLPAEVLAEDDGELMYPDAETVAKTTEQTRLALEKVTKLKIASSLPLRHTQPPGSAQYIRYTSSQQGDPFNSGARQRVIRMVEAQPDPLEPPKFRINNKIPRGPPSPPAPLLHSPSRKVTVKEQLEWKIPPCTSNWKNAKGYTIPLDKRLAVDGRGLQQVHINEKFAKMAEALFIADRKAREAVEARARLEKKLAQKEKERKEEMLRLMAQRAREERAGLRNPQAGEFSGFGGAEARERNDLRAERHRERQRERNLQRAAPEQRFKMQRERERDISEQIALGLPGHRGQGNGEALFDQRLFNTTKGMDSGYGNDEAYNVYDKPWRNSNALAAHLYKPSKQADSDNYGVNLDAIVKTDRFVPDKQFLGATSQRCGPVEFEKDEDPFGLDQFLNMAKKATKRAEEKISEPSSQPEGRSKRSRRI